MGPDSMSRKVADLIAPTLRHRKRYADGGGDLSDADQAAMSPETYANPLARSMMSGIGSMVAAPGKFAAPNPYPPGSEEASWYEDQRAKMGTDWSAGTALSMTGGAGVVPAEANALRTGIGINAKLTAPQLQKYAQFSRLENKGATPEMNYSLSNWYRGADDKPRYWLSDQNAKLSENVIERTPNQYPDAMAEVPPTTWDRGQKATKENPEGYTPGEWRETKLSDIWDHPELFNAYPHLKDVKVLPEKNPDWNGHYSPSTNTIFVKKQMPNDFEDTLHHEVIHAIQRKEGFTSGSNAELFQPRGFADLVSAFNERQKLLEQRIKDLGYDYWSARLVQGKEAKGLSPYETEMRKKLEDDGLLHEIAVSRKVEAGIQDIRSDAWKKYAHNAGESEARDAPYLRRNPGVLKPGQIPWAVNPELEPGRALTTKAGGGGLDLPDAPWATAPQAGGASDLPDAPWATAPDPSKLPDVGAPAMSAGQEEFSPGVPALNKLADAASQSFGKAVGNVPASAERFGEGIAQTVMHPIDTATDIGHLVAGAAQYAGVPGESYKPYAAAAGKAIMDRYGSLEAAKKTFEEDPVGFAADVWSVVDGGAGLARGVGALPRQAAHVAAPTTREIYEASQHNYNNMKGYGVELHPHVMDQVATNIETELLNEGYRDYIPGHGALFNAVNELRNPVGRYSTISDIDGPRRVLNKLAGDPALRDGARRAIGEIDTALGSLTPADAAINGHFIPQVAQEAQRARGNYAAYKHAQQVEEATNAAELQAASTGSGANIDNATRQKFKAILTNPKKQRGFTADELTQMRQIVNGSFAGNAARLVGKLAPTGVVSGSLGAMLGHTLGHTIGVPVIGGIAKSLGDATTRQAANRMSEQVRLRSPEARRLGATPAPAVLPRMAGRAADQARRLNLAGRAATTAEQAPGPFDTTATPFTQ